MTAIINLYECSINDEITHHGAWHGLISGLKAEKLLRGKKKPFLYILRDGEIENENEKNYYITFLDSNFFIKHQPFVITMSPEGWFYEQGGPGGPFQSASIDDVIHLIIHCPKDSPNPLIKL